MNMKTLLVPVDFTATSENAVNLAAEWSRRYGYDRIILLKTFYNSMFENMVVSAEYSNVNQDYLNNERDKITGQLRELCHRLGSKTGPQVKVTTAVSEMPLLRSIIEVIENEKPELMILGSDNYSQSSGGFIADNIINIARSSPVRVLIIPADYTYIPVKEALVTFDFNTLNTLDKLNSLKTAQQWSDIRLLVLNVDASERYLKPDKKFSEMENSLHNYLKNFQHEIYYSNDRNVINGIMNFTKTNNVQLIIALPGRHSFLYSLTHKSISEAIYRNARQPVLILK
jgi:nucleotide-binding universal stress UspA family protein